MKTARTCIVWLVSVLAGCAGADMSAGRGESFAAIATSQGATSSGGISPGFTYPGASTTGAVLTLAIYALLTGIWRDPPYTRVVPEMLEGRGISEVDCTKPIEDWTKNLKCR